MAERRKGTLAHINRIQGQIEALKRAIADQEECLKVASLATSISNSFESLRFRTLEGFLIHDIGVARGPVGARGARLHALLKLYKGY